VIHVHPEAARRALVAHLGLAARVRRPFSETVAVLGAVQMDPMRVVAPAHLLTVRLRRGSTSEVALSRALSAGSVFEARLKERCLVAAQDLPAAAAEFHRVRGLNLIGRFGLSQVADDLLSVLARGSRYSRELATEHRVATFWDPDPTSMKATTMALDILAEEGRLIVTGRRRGERRYDLPERLFPHWREAIAQPERTRMQAGLHYGRTMGVFLASDPYLGWQRGDPKARRTLAKDMLAEGAWAELEIAGSPRKYLCTQSFKELCADPPAVRGVHLLAPLDNLLWDRRRLLDLFGFAYTWEAYTPAAKRSVGPYGMPVLLDGTLIGEVDARRDREGIVRWRLVPRKRIRARDLERIARAVDRLARDLGTTSAPTQQGENRSM